MWHALGNVVLASMASAEAAPGTSTRTARLFRILELGGWKYPAILRYLAHKEPGDDVSEVHAINCAVDASESEAEGS